MNRSLRDENGAFAIEAALGLTVFLLSVMAIMCMSLIVRVQANMQYAVDQTAKELSSYYYLLDATGIANITSGAAGAKSKEKVEEVNTMINNVFDFSASTKETVESFAGTDDYSLGNLVDIAENGYDKISVSGSQLWESLKKCKDDPMGQVKAVVSVFAHTFGNQAMTQLVTPYLCRLLMPKYLSGSYDATEEYLKSVGIEGGFDDIDFSYSNMLKDGRTINVVVMYKINTKKLTFGLVDHDMYFKQNATTAAWVTPNNGTLQTISGAKKNNSSSSSAGGD